MGRPYLERRHPVRRAGTCSGWLAAFTWGLALLAEDMHRQQTPWVGPALAATAAAICAAVAALVKRRSLIEARATNAARTGSLTASFAWGAASLLLSVAVVVPLVVAIATGMAVGGSSSLTCQGDTCGYGSP